MQIFICLLNCIAAFLELNIVGNVAVLLGIVLSAIQHNTYYIVLMYEEIDWQAEGKSVIQDVQAHVKKMCISSVPSSSGIYLNLTTLESCKFCVFLGPSGFLVVGNDYDDISLEKSNHVFYETPYALLSSISPSYDQSFGNLLIERLNNLKKSI